MPEMGATKFDNLCHKVFTARDNSVDFLSRETGVKCGHCGNALVAYYCESRLYMVQCRHCKIRAVVMANSRKEAAEKTLNDSDFNLSELRKFLHDFAYIPYGQGGFCYRSSQKKQRKMRRRMGKGR